jgi:putative ABC transport system permease protein
MPPAILQLPVLTLPDLALAIAPVLLSVGLLAWHRLPASQQLLGAILRATVQLLVLGIFLNFVTTTSSPGLLALGCLLPIAVAIIAISSRLGQSWHQLLLPVALAIGPSTLLVVGYAYSALPLPLQYLPVLVGLLMAAAPSILMSAGERFLQILRQERGAIETRLSLGASSSQAAHSYRQLVWQQCLQPTIQAMSLAGFVTLPSCMGGLVLAGLPMLQAAAYQILLLAMTITQQVLSIGLLLLGLTWFAFDAQSRPKEI